MSDLPHVENHMVVPYCDDETTERFLPDPDEAYDLERADELDRANSLSHDLGIAIAHIAKRNSFDKENLIKLLKRARDYVDDEPAAFGRRQVG